MFYVFSGLKILPQHPTQRLPEQKGLLRVETRSQRFLDSF
jgi:hypothetical protein